MTYQEMLAYCASQRGESGFCNCSSACSGPSPSNLAADHPFPRGVTVYRGGRRGGCVFEVEEAR